MARKPRIHLKGAVYHVMLRGNDGQQIFFEKSDYNRFEYIVENGIERYLHKIHGYCWMSNHVHIIIEVSDVPLTKIMHNLSFRYTQWFNKKYGRKGHLFQGRYKAILVDADNYLLELLKYIHLNPVRSGIVSRPEQYGWSGHRSYLGLHSTDWLTTKWVLQRFSVNVYDAIIEYQKFVTGTTDRGLEKIFYSENQTGAPVQIDQTEPEVSRKNRNHKTISEISQRICKHFDITESSLILKQKSRMAAKYRTYIALIVTENGGHIKDVSTYFNRDISTISRQLSNLKQDMNWDKALQSEAEELRQLVYTITQA